MYFAYYAYDILDIEDFQKIPNQICSKIEFEM